MWHNGQPGVDSAPLEQVTKQLNKLVNVIKIVELEPESAVQRELLLVKVKADLDVTATTYDELIRITGGQPMDVA